MAFQIKEKEDVFGCILQIKQTTTLSSRNTLQGEVSDVITLEQLTSPFFSSESDKNVALIFRKIWCFNIHFNKHTCHQLVFELGQSSTRSRCGLLKKLTHGRGPVWEGS